MSDLNPIHKRPTLAEVAAKAGVSRSAVSRTFTEGASVSPATRGKVQAAATALGYRPNVLARSLTTRRTGMVGLVANNFHNPIYLEVFDLFTRAVQPLGLRPLIVNLTDEVDPARSADMLQQYQVDAVVVASSTLPIGFADAFANAHIPVIHAFGRPGSDDRIHVVGIDNVEAGRMAARRLIQNGRRQLGYLGGPERATSSRDRLDGFLDVLKQHPEIDYRVHFAGDYTFEAGFQAMAGQILKGPAQAYFCGDDVISMGAISALKKSGLDVPADVGVIGFNDMEMAGYESVQLSTISQPLDQIIQVTAQLLDSIINQSQRPAAQTTLLPCKVIERQTLPERC